MAEKPDATKKSNEEVELAETSNEKISFKNKRKMPADKWNEEMFNRKENLNTKSKNKKTKTKRKISTIMMTKTSHQ